VSHRSLSELNSSARNHDGDEVHQSKALLMVISCATEAVRAMTSAPQPSCKTLELASVEGAYHLSTGMAQFLEWERVQSSKVWAGGE
jgi:hypothetical protein